MNKYKTYEELKEELGDSFEEYMYKANIELLTKIDKVINLMCEADSWIMKQKPAFANKRIIEARKILKGSDNNE